MKNLKIIFSVFFLNLCLTSGAQIINSPTNEAQTVHATVATLKVSYKAVSQGTINSAEIQSIPQATVNLKTTIGISKIHFKIINKNTNTVIYQVNYTLNSPIIIHENGKKLFENNNGVIYLSSGESIALKPYIYQVQTENNQTILSTVFSAIQ